MTFSTAQSSTELDWKSSCRQIFWECCIYMEVASCWGFRKMPIQDKRNNALAVFGNAITNADLKVYWHSWCSHPRQLVYKKKSLGKLFEQSVCCSVWISWEKCTYQSFLKAAWMTLLNFLGHSLVAKRKTDGKYCWALICHFLSFFIFAGTSLCLGEGSRIHVLLLINCIYSDTMDIKVTYRFMVESI